MKKNLDKWLGNFLVLLFAIMVIAVTWQVVSRYILQSPSTFTEELSRYLLIWIGTLGAAYAAGQKDHLAIDLLEPSLAPDKNKILHKVINTLIILFCIAVLIIGGTNLVLVNVELGQKSAALKVPLYIVYSVLPISGIVVIIYKILDFNNPKTTTHDS